MEEEKENKEGERKERKTREEGEKKKEEREMKKKREGGWGWGVKQAFRMRPMDFHRKKNREGIASNVEKREIKVETIGRERGEKRGGRR